MAFLSASRAAHAKGWGHWHNGRLGTFIHLNLMVSGLEGEYFFGGIWREARQSGRKEEKEMRTVHSGIHRWKGFDAIRKNIFMNVPKLNSFFLIFVTYKIYQDLLKIIKIFNFSSLYSWLTDFYQDLLKIIKVLQFKDTFKSWKTE
jgi:hypothetical protein